MKITIDELFRKEACSRSIKKFMKLKLEKVDWNEIDKIKVYSQRNLEDLQWLIEKDFKIFPIKIKFKNYFGNWQIFEYDENGNQIRYENSSGNWQIFEYDDNGNKIREEDSKKNWINWKYDENGNLIRVENSLGYINNFIYGEKGKLKNIEIKNFYLDKNDLKIKLIKGE